jgi:hypothetical protein
MVFVQVITKLTGLMGFAVPAGTAPKLTDGFVVVQAPEMTPDSVYVMLKLAPPELVTRITGDAVYAPIPVNWANVARSET